MHTGRTRAWSRAATRGLQFLTAATALASALPLVAKYGWALDLFTHFRLQLIAVQALLLIALVITRLRLSSVALIALIGANVYASHDYLLRRGDRADGGRDLRVMAANVQARNTRAAGLLAQIEREQPDVLAILEFTESWAARLAPLGKTYPHRVEVPRDDAFGIALFAREPILAHRVIDLESAPAIDARLAGALGDIRVIAVHAMSPTSPTALASRQRQLEQLAALAAAATEPLVILGDLNLSPFSPYFAEFLDRARLHDALAGLGPNITWPTFFPLLGIPIDHCLLSPHWGSIAYRRQPAYGSDHYAIAVDLARKAR